MTGRVLAIGFFDGVHMGHAQLLRRAADIAQEKELIACAVTFDSHPQAVITGRPVPLLCSREERSELIRGKFGINEIIFEKFTDELMRLDWKQYITDVLINEMCGAHIVAGYDFTFGYKGEGNAERLSGACTELGIGCDIVPPFRIDGIRVSSTYIRGLIAEGDMEKAEVFLGHRYRLFGEIIHGKELGRALGFPTVNLALPSERQSPAWGVYATYVLLHGKSYPAVTNVGLRPTVERSSAPTVESTLLDFNENLYGERIDVDFVKFLRPEKRFESVAELKEQISRDIAKARTIL